MKFEPGNIYFNKIYIIQSLRPGDRLTGNELYEDIIRRRTSDSMVAELRDISDGIQLFDYLGAIERRVSEGFFPFIHFETHGFKEGIQLGNNECITWSDLVPHFRRINGAAKNNLFISIAACEGGNIQFCIKITEPSPFRGFIGPMEKVVECDLLNSFSDFFNVLLLENDVENGIRALNATAQLTEYHHMNVESFFEAIWDQYQTKMESPKRKSDLVEYLLNEQLRLNPNVTALYESRSHLLSSIEEFLQKDLSTLKEILRRQFCHI